MGVTSSRLLVGNDEPVPRTLRLRAGPLVLRLRGTRLLSMHAAGHEVWHGAAFLYRDEGWGTPEPVADQITHTSLPDGFQVRIRAHIPARHRIELRVEIEGRADGSVTYEAHATPAADLPANRIGLCLLHPQAAMGRPLQVTHVDGRTSDSSFPTQVPAWPPFTGVRALRHEYAAGAWASCQFDGDAFEVEDQRNNADASFKTYSRSNFMPRPFRLRAGVTLSQRMDLRLEGLPEPAPVSEPPHLAACQAWTSVPALGIGMAADDAWSEAAALEALGELAPGRLHLRLSSPGQPVHWAGVRRLLDAAGAQLRLDIEGLDSDGETDALRGLGRELDAAGVRPVAVAVFPGTPAQLQAARQAFSGAALGGGTPHFFVQLNRAEGLGQVDFLSFTTSSIVHDADDEAVMLGLQSLPWLLRTLEANHGAVPVQVGPSSIAAPRSPLGPQPASDGTRRIPLARRDPRTGALFGAAWLLGHVAALAQAGAQAISVLELRGDQGLLAQRPDGTLVRRPAFFVLRDLARARRLCCVPMSPNGQFAALWLESEAHCSLLVANLTGAPLHLQLPAEGEWVCRCLDAVRVEAGASDPWRQVSLAQAQRLELPAWAVMRVSPADGNFPEHNKPRARPATSAQDAGR